LRKYCIREFSDHDLENILHFVSDMLVNEFNITLDFDNLDSDLLNIKNNYNKDNGGYFWIVELTDNHQIIGTVAIRKLKEFESAFAESKRMFLSKKYRGLNDDLRADVFMKKNL
jgi:flavin-dependent dehydrogenase